MNRNIRMGVFFILGLMFALPAHASVSMNEIAWMGSAVSSTDEWIELRNDSTQAVDLSGWKIEASDGSPLIPLSGTISANGYFLIERTDDATVANIPADLVVAFGNGLSNSGETLRVIDAVGGIIDEVVGGADWANIGGNNETKETAQRTSSGWVTGVATPRNENITSTGEVLGVSVVASGVSTGASSAPSTPAATVVANPTYPRKDISVSAGEDKRVFALFPTSFEGRATGLYDESLLNASYRWNFGDGSIATGKDVTHAFELPGEYVVTLEVFWSTFHKTDRMAVVVTKPEVSISKTVVGTSGYIELLNHSDREIDLSGWTLHDAGIPFFTFSPHSIILAKKVFLLSNKITQYSGNGTLLSLHYPDGASAYAAQGSVTAPLPVKSALGKSLIVPTSRAKSITPNTSPAASAEVAGTSTPEVLWENTSTQLVAGAASGGYAFGDNSQWIFILFAMFLISLAGFMIARSNAGEVTAADEYAIIEDIIEGREDLREGR